MPLPRPGAKVPVRNYGPLSAIGRFWLRLAGWRIEGSLPDIPRAVVVVAPHSSNWDFVHAIAAVFALRLRVAFIGKHTLFEGPFAALMRWLGGVPVDRTNPEGVAQAVAATIRGSHGVWLGVAPEGTRAAGAAFKTGFHRIAAAAGVPIIPVSIDYRHRVIVVHPAREIGADAQADTDAIRGLLYGHGCRREHARAPRPNTPG